TCLLPQELYLPLEVCEFAGNSHVEFLQNLRADGDVSNRAFGLKNLPGSGFLPWRVLIKQVDQHIGIEKRLHRERSWRSSRFHRAEPLRERDFFERCTISVMIASWLGRKPVYDSKCSLTKAL